LRPDGSVACWGDNQVGESTPASGSFTQIASGYAYTCGLRANGFVNCWGDLVTPDP
jgi:hypothetical protein